MSLAPINPSDLIPITGAYAHRIPLPSIVGYEGIGRVIGAPAEHAGLLGKRVLPIRGPGTWHTCVDCDPELAIPVPDGVDDLLAARAYINSLAAMTMLDRWPVAGKCVLLSGAGSACAELLGHWALQQGAAAVQGIYRSESRVQRLLDRGVEPIAMDDMKAIESAAERAESLSIPWAGWSVPPSWHRWAQARCSSATGCCRGRIYAAALDCARHIGEHAARPGAAKPVLCFD